ncbi:hypothetical protein ACHHYP_16027 [Achlya hypogyna]|uniref:Uncharacterized protein n=1 Tax=Achlya hypogyna TaxID=1202772 RepID=A0A1V9ZEA2_ACHHY|nr:hypothetical protein ACHHYP_16027 [Achlya hypogyna]
MWSSQSDEDMQDIEEEVLGGNAPEDPGQEVGAAESLDEEMEVMKNVFHRMSEKKARQKEQSQHECVQVYTTAFQKDVDVLYATAKKKRMAEAKNIAETIQSTVMRISEQKSHLTTVHETYQANFADGIARVEDELTRLQSLRETIVAAYESSKKQLDESFADAFANVDAAAKKLEDSSVHILADTSYLNAFQHEVARLTVD